MHVLYLLYSFENFLANMNDILSIVCKVHHRFRFWNIQDINYLIFLLDYNSFILLLVIFLNVHKIVY